MPRALAIAFCAAILAACARTGANTDPQSDWLSVLGQKKQAVASNSPAARQNYADVLSAFVSRHPGHSRAREVYQRIQLDFARELSAIGRYRDAIRFCRAVLRKDPGNAEASRLINAAIDHLSVSRDKLLALRKGMTEKEVASILGKPVPGWKLAIRRDDSITESWYYRRSNGGVVSVHFVRGRLIAADERSEAKLAPVSAGL
jgi:hypothetical protein